MPELKYKDITEKITGASFEVRKFLGNACQLCLRVATAKQGRTGRVQTMIWGEIKVETKEIGWSVFIIQLPF